MTNFEKISRRWKKLCQSNLNVRDSEDVYLTMCQAQCARKIS